MSIDVRRDGRGGRRLACLIAFWGGRPRWSAFGEGAAAAAAVASVLAFLWVKPRWWWLPSELIKLAAVPYPAREATPAASISTDIDRHSGSAITTDVGVDREKLKPGEITAYGDNVQFPALLWNNTFSNKVVYVHGGTGYFDRVNAMGARWVYCRNGIPSAPSSPPRPPGRPRRGRTSASTTPRTSAASIAVSRPEAGRPSPPARKRRARGETRARTRSGRHDRHDAGLGFRIAHFPELADDAVNDILVREGRPLVGHRFFRDPVLGEDELNPDGAPERLILLAPCLVAGLKRPKVRAHAGLNRLGGQAVGVLGVRGREATAERWRRSSPGRYRTRTRSPCPRCSSRSLWWRGKRRGARWVRA